MKQLLIMYQLQLITVMSHYNSKVALLDYNDYVGRIGIGYVFRGKMVPEIMYH